MEGGRVDGSWLMGVVSHGYGGLGGGRNGGGAWHVCGITPVVLLTCREMSEHFQSASEDTRSHRLPGAQLWVWSSWNWSALLRRPLHAMPREGSGSLSMHPVRCTQWCSMNSAGAFKREVWNAVQVRRATVVDAATFTAAARSSKVNVI